METEILKIVAWPIVALIFGIVALTMCRKSINNAILNLKRVGTTSISLEMNGQAANSEKVEKDQTELLMGRFSEYTKPLEDNIDKIIADKKMSNPQEIIKMLKEHSALWLLAYQYEIIYSVLFGTQISLMQHLNAQSGGVTVDGIDPYYKTAISRGLKVPSRENYVAYLVSSKLVEFKENKYFLTLFGRGFLHFLLEANKEVERAF